MRTVTAWKRALCGRRAGMLLTALSLLLCTAGCSLSGRSCPRAVPKAGDVLRVGITPNYPPLAFKEEGEIVGIDADLAQKLSRETGFRVAFKELPWEDLIPALRDDRIDVIMSGMSITEERAQLVSFTVPYLQVGQMALIRAEDYLRLVEPGMMSRPGSRVGFQAGTTGEDYARMNLPEAVLVGLPDAEAGIAALRDRRIDFFLHDAPTIWHTTGRRATENDDLLGLYTPLTDEYLAWAVRMEDADTLGRLLDTVLLRWQRTGQLQKVRDRWITVRKRPVLAVP